MGEVHCFCMHPAGIQNLASKHAKDDVDDQKQWQTAPAQHCYEQDMLTCLEWRSSKTACNASWQATVQAQHVRRQEHGHRLL